MTVGARFRVVTNDFDVVVFACSLSQNLSSQCPQFLLINCASGIHLPKLHGRLFCGCGTCRWNVLGGLRFQKLSLDISNLDGLHALNCSEVFVGASSIVRRRSHYMIRKALCWYSKTPSDALGVPISGCSNSFDFGVALFSRVNCAFASWRTLHIIPDGGVQFRHLC